ncbi:MAG: cation-translocating P-type ATPase [Minisyncoccota bacterium]
MYQEKERKTWYQMTAEEVMHIMRSRLGGLTQEEATERLREVGENKIRQQRKYVGLKLFFKQWNDVFVWILATAGIFAFVLGEMRDASIVAVIILINMIIGFVQEYKAERIMEQLSKFVADIATVFRDGEKRDIPVAELVPGDVVAVDAGASIPADGYVLEAYNFKVNSFIFTGESFPEERHSGMMTGVVAKSDVENMVFMGESVAGGEARIMVVTTGMQTELGRMAHMTHTIEQTPTPLQKKMATFAQRIAWLAIAIAILVILVSQYQGMTLYQSFLLGLALAVSVVPEGLPAAVSVAFALGMKHLLKYNVLAKRLSAVETLGSVSVICSDKTGTITKNELSVTTLVIGQDSYQVSGTGYTPSGDFLRDGHVINPSAIVSAEMLFRIGVLANDASLGKQDTRYVVTGDPTEGAIIVVARKYNARPDFFLAGFHKKAENPFTSERRLMSVAYTNGEVRSYVKGAPESVLALADEWLDNGIRKPFTDIDKAKVKALYDELSEQALRVIGFAYRELDHIPEAHYQDEMEQHLVWVGMMAMMDPPREGIREAIAECHRLGIKVVMVTGDYEKTALAIAERIGLKTREMISVNGTTFDTFSDEALVRAVQSGGVFSRIAPEQKLRLATVLQSAGEVVAMTGDGVNDALALKKADIGVAMGIMGTDVSKDAADMILLDDHFTSIVQSVREGRRIFANLRKFVQYVFTSNASELFITLLGFLFHIPSPMTAVQILAIDLATDVFPSFALGVEPDEPTNTVSRPMAKQNIMDKQGIVRILSIGLLMAIGGLIAFFLVLIRGGWVYGMSIDTDGMLYQQATTAAYVTLALTQMANLLQLRSETRSFFWIPFFSNPWIFVGMGISIALLIAFTTIPVLQSLLGMTTLKSADWFFAGFCTLIIFTYDEIRKRRIRMKK